ncbi:SDR family oxidoreductase [Chitinophaga oryziterrae]|uniref:SDR family oxidoreductase n=1 Tax=Chitinophaga oryziterrae TaxID=1031224 RepID=A0A6N8JB94_9BACT|nr:SDR family oxidoreductase [Chitinophaga oryziterrae]MVT41392.1 SDR family oxidoreductase [Chitinophaga oryziterrae]
MGLLSDKIIILTGGSMGIGFECAKKYAEAGARVVVLSNDSISLADAMKELGVKHHGIVCDVSVGEEVAEAIEETIQRFGRIDAIHNNAGIAAPSKPLHLTEEDEWDRLFEVNVKSIYLTTKYGLEALKLTQGSILNTSSLVADIGQENHAAYTGTKGAVNSLTKSMALDYARFNIRVNALAPAAVWTPLLREWNSEQDNESMEEYLAQIHPLGYCPEGDVIADAGVFLLSDKARFITGCILPVTGGAELGYRRLHH